MRRRDFIAGITGLAAAWPRSARAQQAVIGFMSSRSPEDSVDVVAAFRRGLGDRGLIEGQNVVIEFRWARGEYARLPALAAELVSRPVGVLVAPALRRPTRRRPRPRPYRSSSAALIRSNLGVASLNQPGGNATGVHLLTTDVEAKRLGLLHELPHATACPLPAEGDIRAREADFSF
jgi:putative ABC transport system substrate-binding protein